MQLSIKVIPRAKQEKIVERNGVLRVYVNQPPEDGRANEAVIKILSEYFKKPRAAIKIIRGETGREKTIEIL